MLDGQNLDLICAPEEGQVQVLLVQDLVNGEGYQTARCRGVFGPSKVQVDDLEPSSLDKKTTDCFLFDDAD
jgi:hypothetical protein